MRSVQRFAPRRLAAWSFAALSVASLLVAGGARAAVGEAGFAFLKIGVGARAMGLGSAYVAVADDPSALHWNPAGLASGKDGIRLTAMHNEWIEDFRQEYAAVSGPVGPGTLGASFNGFYTSELERRDETGVLTGHFGFNDIAATLGYGATVAEGIDAGASIRYIREMIADEDATSVAFDLGGRYRLRDTGLSFGAAVQNLGGEATFVSEGFPLPRTIRAGVAYKRAIASAQSTALLTTEYRSARGDDGRFHVGGEFGYREWLALRAGMKFGYDEQDVSFGLGVARGPIRFDYAILPVGANLGTSHFFSLSADL
ncbi:MAG TPA: PorV/PorQ family protein [Acidobacteriota bacterium]|nr:PorV/PorQ family protein [Acidobacteriota bacterium]